MIELIAGVDEMIKFGNISALFTPVANEEFLSDNGMKFLSENPKDAFRKGNFKKVIINIKSQK